MKDSVNILFVCGYGVGRRNLPGRQRSIDADDAFD